MALQQRIAVQTNNGTVYEGIFDSLKGSDVVLRYAKMVAKEGKDTGGKEAFKCVIIKGTHLAQLQADNIRADGELIGASRVVKSGFDGDSYVIDTNKCASSIQVLESALCWRARVYRVQLGRRRDTAVPLPGCHFTCVLHVCAQLRKHVKL